MIGARRLAVIEEKQYKDPAPIIHLRNKIDEIQRQILIEIYPEAVRPTRRRTMAVTLGKLVTKTLFTYTESTFKSIETLNETFKGIATELNRQFDKLGILTSHEHAPLCEGLRLVLKWYQVLSIEAFLKIQLTSELAHEEYKEINTTQELIIKKEALKKKIDYFNLKMSEAEDNFARQRNNQFDFTSDDINTIFCRLLKEEKAFSSSGYSMIEKFKQERNTLEANLAQFNLEVDEAIKEFKRTSETEEQNRCDLVKSKLNKIDVYYVSEFVKSNPVVMQKYNEYFDQKKQKYLKRIIEILSSTVPLTIMLKETKDELSSFYSNTYSDPFGLYQYVPVMRPKAVNGTYQLLNKQITQFESAEDKSNTNDMKSEVLALDSKYTKLYKKTCNKKKKAEDAYVDAAEQFLSKFENKPRQILAIRDEANKNFESEIQNFIKRLKPANDQLEINPLSLPEYYNKNMNKAWTDTFKQYFKKELNHLTQEFDKIKFDKSEFISEKVKQLCSDFSSKKLLILRDVVTEEKLKQRYGVVLTIFNETYAQLCRDPVFAEIESYFIEYENEIERGHQKERQQQIEQEKKKAEQKPMEVKMEMPVIIPVVKPIINLSRPYSAPVIEEQPKEYKSPPVVVKQNKLESVPRASDDNMSSWKRAVLCGLLSTVIIGLSLTIFGLFLEITLGVALAIVITGVVIGGAEYGVSGYHSQYPGNWPPASTMTIQTQKDNQTRLTVTSANTQDSPQKTLATGSIIKAKGNPWWGFFNHTDSGSKAKANDQLEAKIEKRKIYR